MPHDHRVTDTGLEILDHPLVLRPASTPVRGAVVVDVGVCNRPAAPFRLLAALLHLARHAKRVALVIIRDPGIDRGPTDRLRHEETLSKSTEACANVIRASLRRESRLVVHSQNILGTEWDHGVARNPNDLRSPCNLDAEEAAPVLEFDGHSLDTHVNFGEREDPLGNRSRQGHPAIIARPGSGYGGRASSPMRAPMPSADHRYGSCDDRSIGVPAASIWRSRGGPPACSSPFG